MCDKSGWSPLAFCGPRGQCINSVCVCEAGWGTDLSFFKTNKNCWLPFPALQVIEGTVGFASLLVFLLAVWGSHKTRSHARTYLRLTALAMLFSAGYCLAHFLEGGTHGVASVIMLNFTIRAASDAIALALYQMLKSFWKMSGKGQRFKRAVIISQVVEFILLSACTIAMIVLNDNPEGFSLALSVFALIFGLHMIVLWGFIAISTTSVINTVERATTTTTNAAAGVGAQQDNPNWESSGPASSKTSGVASSSPPSANSGPAKQRRSTLQALMGRNNSFTGSSSRLLDKRSQHLVDKVRKYRKYGMLIGPLVIVFVFVVCLLEWILGTVPLLWVMWTIAIIHLPLIGLTQLILGRANPDKGSSPDVITQQLLSTPQPITGGL
jgi:hypothetical protein